VLWIWGFYKSASTAKYFSVSISVFILKQIKYEKGLFLKKCPACRAMEILLSYSHPDFPSPAKLNSLCALWGIYHCRHCHSSFFLARPFVSRHVHKHALSSPYLSVYSAAFLLIIVLPFKFLSVSFVCLSLASHLNCIHLSVDEALLLVMCTISKGTVFLVI